jgi:chaperonin cofactor prefoldin
MNEKCKNWWFNDHALFGKLVDIQYDMAHQLKTLINAEWDSNTMKSKLEKLVKDFDKINKELEKLDNDT